MDSDNWQQQFCIHERRNLRYSDSPSFQGIRYFIQRYLSDAALDLEFRHLWKLYEDLTGHKTPLIIIDSIGIDSRKKSLFAKVHGRYYTIGFILSEYPAALLRLGQTTINATSTP